MFVERERERKVCVLFIGFNNGFYKMAAAEYLELDKIFYLKQSSFSF